MINKVYYINLDKRVDRNIHVNHELKKLNFKGNIERVPAVDGKILNINTISSSLLTDEGKYDTLDSKAPLYYKLTRGSVGCAFSHLNVYNKIIDELSDNEYALILEDDIYIDNDFTIKLNKYIENIPSFDILFLGYHSINPIEDNNNNNIYGKPKKLWGLFSYIINKKAATVIKDIFPLRYQIDTEMPKIFNKLEVFYLKDKLITSDESQKVDSKFGTDTQIREDFKNVSSTYNNFILIILIIIIFYFVYNLYYKNYNGL